MFSLSNRNKAQMQCFIFSVNTTLEVLFRQIGQEIKALGWQGRSKTSYQHMIQYRMCVYFLLHFSLTASHVDVMHSACSHLFPCPVSLPLLQLSLLSTNIFPTFVSVVSIAGETALYIGSVANNTGLCFLLVLGLSVLNTIRPH